MDINHPNYKNLQPYQRLVSIDDIIKAKESKKNNNKDISKDDKEGKEGKETKEEKKFNAFTGKGVTLCDNGNSTNNSNNIIPSQFEDDEMKQAYELSLDEYIKDIVADIPKEPADNCKESFNIILKYSDKAFSRRFASTDKINVSRSNNT